MNRAKLPKGVYLDRGRYSFRPYLGNGKLGKRIPLGPESLSIAQVWDAYERAASTTVPLTVKWMLEEYLKSNTFKSRAPKTRSEYKRYTNVLCNYKAASGHLLGEFPVDAVTKKGVQKYLDDADKRIAANRQIEFLSAAYSWASRRLDGVSENPCLGVEYNRERPRDRYVTDAEYDLVYQLALKNKRCAYLPIVMELIYLCRARPSEILTMTKDKIQDHGLFLERGKGSENEITLWSDRLETAVITALENWPNGEYLLYDERGQPLTYNAFAKSSRRLMKKAIDAGLKQKFTFHDLKAKGVSDHSQKFAGHRSEKMKLVYDRVPGLIKSTR